MCLAARLRAWFLLLRRNPCRNFFDRLIEIADVCKLGIAETVIVLTLLAAIGRGASRPRATALRPFEESSGVVERHSAPGHKWRAAANNSFFRQRTRRGLVAALGQELGRFGTA